MKNIMIAASLLPLLYAPVLADKKHDVADLVGRLKSNDVDERERAAQALGQMGPDAEAAIEPLRKALNDDLPYVRIRAAEALSKIGPAAIPAFRDALKNESAEVRGLGASALGMYGKDATEAIPDLVKTLDDPESPVRQRAVHALEQMGPPAAASVMDYVEDTHGSSRLLGLQILATVPTGDGALVARLIKLLEDHDHQVQVAAAKALVCQSRGHIPDLIEGFQSDNPTVRMEIGNVLADLGKHGAAAVPALIRQLKDASPQVRASAARALGKMGSDALVAVPALREASKDSEALVSAKAIEALTSITVLYGEEKEEKKAIETASPLPTPKPTAKSTAKAKPKPAAVPVAPVKKPAPVRKVAPKKVKTPPPPTPQELLAQLQNPDVAVSSTAAQAMVQRSSETAPVLIQALQEGGTTFAEVVADLLEKIGTPEAKKAVDAYRKRLMEKRTLSLIKDLRQEGKHSADAIPALVKIGAPIVQPVAQVLGDPKPASRLAAATVLNRLGATASPATSSLIVALEDKDPDVRQQAAEALEKIGTPEAKKALRFFTVKDKFKRQISVFQH